jgi:hypothetical protein
MPKIRRKFTVDTTRALRFALLKIFSQPLAALTRLQASVDVGIVALEHS